MRALLPILQKLPGTLTLSLSTLLVVACTSDYRPPAEPPEINTYNAYVNNSDNSINYFTSNNNTITSYKVTTFEPAQSGFQNTLFLNTDEEKQGFEYIAYVTKDSNDKSTINLYDLNKSNAGIRYSLATISSHVCGITNTLIPSSYAFSSGQQTNISTKHATEIIMQLSSSPDCSDNLSYEKADFSNLVDEDDQNNTQFEHSFIEASQTNPILITNYKSNSFTGTGQSYGHLSYNGISSELSFHYVEERNDEDPESFLWTTILPVDEPMSFAQVSNNHVLFQQGPNLYVVETSILFSIDDPDSNQSLPIQDKINALFDVPTMTLTSANLTLTTNESILLDRFVLQVENELFLYLNDTFHKVFSSSIGTESLSLSFLLSEAGVLVLSQENNERDNLQFISTNGQASSIMSAESIDISLNGDVFYANSFNYTADSGHQSHIIEKLNGNIQMKTFNDSTLLHVYDMRNETDLPLLLSSQPPVENISSTRQLNGTYLYKFDDSKENGRALQQSSRENENGQKEYRNVDFSYGVFYELSDISYTGGVIINDYYGYLTFEASHSPNGITKESAEFTYVFNPSQEEPDPDLQDQSLTPLLIN